MSGKASSRSSPASRPHGGYSVWPPCVAPACPAPRPPPPFFTGLSAAWQDVLGQPDGAIGLSPARGRAEVGHYRAALLKLLGEWEGEVNATLEGSYDEFAEGGEKARLTATVPCVRRPAQAPQPKAAPAASGSAPRAKRTRARGDVSVEADYSY